VAGALTERDFVEKLGRAGFGDITIRERRPVSIDDLTLYPLFTEEIIDLMRKLIPHDRQGAVATAVVVTARLRDLAPLPSRDRQG
jgi:arsenite methyltransferase